MPASSRTVSEWFASLDPAPPPALRTTLNVMLAEHASLPATELPEVCMKVAEQALTDMLAAGSSARGTALGLLSVDALVTYAFEAAASDPARFDARALRAMAHISALGEPQAEGDVS